MAESQFRLPWVPLIQRPNFKFYKVRFSIPTRINTNVLYFLIYLSIFYIFAGGVYDLVNKDTIAFGTDSDGGPQLFYPSQDRQFLLEGIAAALVMFMGAGGIYLLGQATSDPHDTGRASTYQIIGGILILIAFIMISSMFNCKVNPGSC
jgi:hypothetical protein